MLDRKFDPSQPYRYALYGRMSDPRQNKRSPDQQFNTIDETVARCRYPWIRIQSYRDDGISGRYLQKRRGLQTMLRAIETGQLRVDLIIVDTLERLGRADEIGELRRKLDVEYGVLVVAADNHFADPTGVVGKAVGLAEQFRSTDDGRIKAHTVVRGKKDAARLKRWPGGPPPFGLRLKAMVNTAVSPQEMYNVLEHDPRQAPALLLAFQRADATGHGLLRLSQWWNDCPDIPADFKPISPTTMGYRLENPISIGILRWGEKRTGVVNQTRVVETNPDGAECIPDFCEPLVSVDLFQRVQKLSHARGQRIKTARQAKETNGPAKLIAPQARGLTLKYLLTGLVRCSACNASMRPIPSGRRSKTGRRYCYYGCPRFLEKSCDNGRYVPEEPLREAVITRLRTRLLSSPGQEESIPPWLPELLCLVRQEQQRFHAHEPNRAAAEAEERRQLEQQLTGWVQSLGNPNLPAAVRSDIEARYAETKRRQQDLLQSAAARQACQKHVDQALDTDAVLAELQKLNNVLADYNPTLGNLELSKHIDVILCQPDGGIELRGTFVGLFSGAADLLCQDEPLPTEAGDPSCPHEAPPEAFQAPTAGYAPVTARRRGRLRVPSLSAAGQSEVGDVDTALDPRRFAGLPQSLRWQESFVLDRILCWAEAHAAEVGELRAAGKTMEELAEHFGKTVPTIRSALKYAKEMDPSLAQVPAKMPRSRWEEHNSKEVVRLHVGGQSVPKIARQLGKSEPTIRKALKYAASQGPAEAEAEPSAGVGDSA